MDSWSMVKWSGVVSGREIELVSQALTFDEPVEIDHSSHSSCSLVFLQRSDQALRYL
jgi:hypothetical protein